VDEADLARSACRIFGHTWGRTGYRAYPHPYTGKLTIVKARRCERCGEEQRLEKES
jgi:hypothetical protein